MKKMSLISIQNFVWALIFVIVSIPTFMNAQLARGLKINPVDFTIPQIDYSDIYKIQAAQRERAVEECLNKFLSRIIKDTENGVYEPQIIDAESSWIKYLVYFEPTAPSSGAENFVVMFTRDDKSYLFTMTKSYFNLWASSASKGDFYHTYVKNNSSFSMRAICEKLVRFSSN